MDDGVNLAWVYGPIGAVVVLFVLGGGVGYYWRKQLTNGNDGNGRNCLAWFRRDNDSVGFPGLVNNNSPGAEDGPGGPEGGPVGPGDNQEAGTISPPPPYSRQDSLQRM